MFLEIDGVEWKKFERIVFDDVAMEIVTDDEATYEKLKKWFKCNEIDYDCRREQYFVNLVEFVVRVYWR